MGTKSQSNGFIPMFSVSINPMRLVVMLTDQAGGGKFKMAASKLHCVHHLATRMQSHRLQLNSTKTELLWCVSVRRQHQIPNAPIAVGSDNITPVRSVRNLGMYVDSDVSMQTHVVNTLAVSLYFAVSAASVDRSPVLY